MNHIEKLPDLLVYLILGFSAFLFGAERLGFVGVFISTTLGSLVGFMTLFWLGGYLGRRFFIERDFFFLKKEDIIRTGNWFKKYGYFIVAFNRFFPGVRSVISIAGGIYKLDRVKVVFLALLSAAMWNLIWISIGYILGSNWGTVENELKIIFARYNFVVFSLFLVLFIYVITRKNKK